ncbi:MAG TPA: glycosyltransferase [Devosia sp.]
MKLNIVIVGLSLSSSWGNGHATTYRSLIPGLVALGHSVHFLERDVRWYAAHRDLPRPTFCELSYYNSIAELSDRFGRLIARADAVIIGSYVPDGVQVIDAIAAMSPQQLSFYDIDTPVTLAKLRAGDEEYIARRQVPLFDTYFSFSGGPTVTRLEREFGARRAAALYCSVDPERYAPTGEPIAWDLGYLGTYSSDRQPILERLLLEPARRLPHMRFVVAGPMYPETIDWPDNVERIDHLPPSEHASFYSRQRFTLNVTRADMRAAGWSPSVRLFEAAATGTPIISDTWPGLTDLLPAPSAIQLAEQPDDVVGVLTEVSAASRRRMAETARSLVLRGHTGTARARELVEGLTQHRPLRDFPSDIEFQIEEKATT